MIWSIAVSTTSVVSLQFEWLWALILSTWDVGAWNDLLVLRNSDLLHHLNTVVQFVCRLGDLDVGMHLRWGARSEESL